MKILWITNTIFPYPTKALGLKENVFGGWMNSLFESLKNTEEISQFAIATTYHGQKLLKLNNENVIYYLLPSSNNTRYETKLEKYWQEVNADFKPDIVHIHGTEYAHGLSYLNIPHSSKTIVSIQGLVSVCGEKYNYNAGIDTKNLIFNATLRDFIKNDLLILQSYRFRKRGIYEKEMLQKCDLIIGRTSWDKAHAFRITLKNKYAVCNESLRQSFYNKKWDISKIERHSIFISQANYPLKGFHNVIKAVAIIKNVFPDLKVYVAGNDIVKYNGGFKEKLKLTGYGMYLRKLINKYNLKDNIIFLGLLNEEKMADKLLKSHVFVQASSIENSSNSLGEAMLLGMPVVASYVGGTADLLKDKEEGFLYPFNEYTMLANYIMEIFNNDNLAIKIGKNAQERAIKTHNLDNNTKKIIDIYKSL